MFSSAAGTAQTMRRESDITKTLTRIAAQENAPALTFSALGARMGLGVDIEQPGGIDVGIALRGRQAGMA